MKGNLPLIDPIPKIVGGTPITEFEFPFLISLQRQGLLTWSHSCGGSIISEKYVLDAAHCVDGSNPANLRIVAGEHSFSENSGYEQYRAVTRYIRHPQYNTNTFENDVSLLEVNLPFDFSDRTKVGPIALPTQELETPAGTITTVTGWGSTSSGGSVVNIARKVDVPIVSDADCGINYGASAIYPSMICAGAAQGGVDSCQGDSGGPLFTSNPTPLHIGIVSWGYGCAVAGYPGVYTQTSYFINWINENMTA